MKNSFLIEPSGSGPIWLLVVVLIVTVGISAVIFSFVYASRHARIELSAEGVRVRGDIYGRLIPWEKIDRDAVEAIDLSTRPELRLKLRTNGAGLPGYGSGWFRLQNGGSALAFITSPRSVLVVPTRDDYVVLFSTPEAPAAATAIREFKLKSAGV